MRRSQARMPRVRQNRSSSQFRQLFELARAIAEFLSRNPEFVQQGQLKVRQWRMFRIDEVAAALQRPSASTQKQGWQRAVGVPVAVTDAASEEQDDVIEQ